MRGVDPLAQDFVRPDFDVGNRSHGVSIRSMASTGQTSRHSPQSMQREFKTTSGSGSPGRIAAAGHVRRQAPQPWQPEMWYVTSVMTATDIHVV
jgi:hypothetical protein